MKSEILGMKFSNLYFNKSPKDDSDALFFLIFKSLREKERERERESELELARNRERKRERIPSRLHAVSAEPNSGLDITNCEIMT